MQEVATPPPPDCSLIVDNEPGFLFCPTTLLSSPCSQDPATESLPINTAVPWLGCCPIGDLPPSRTSKRCQFSSSSPVSLINFPVRPPQVPCSH